MDLHASLPLHKGYYKYKSGHIYYEIKGKGAPLLLIPGGSGDCWWLHKIADALSGNFQVISYDLYGKARSITHTPSNIDINQFATDAINLVTALGLEKVYIVGVSSGAVIALDIAEKYPAYVKEMIVFEPPLICIHPRFDALSKHFAKVYLTALKWGESIAGLRFALGTGLPIAPILRSGSAYKDHLKNCTDTRMKPDIGREFLETVLLVNYRPDFEKIRNNQVLIYTGAATASVKKRRFYAENAQIIAAELACEEILFPGHHFSFFHFAEQCADVICSTFVTNRLSGQSIKQGS